MKSNKSFSSEVAVISAVALLALVLTAAAPLAQAQGTSNGFVSSSDAAAFYTGAAGQPKTWNVGTHLTQSFDFIDWASSGSTTKGNHISLTADQFLSPAAGVSLYTAGLQVQPDFSSLLNKTNVAPGSLNAFLSGGVGAGSVGSGNNQLGWFVGGGLHLLISPSVSWSTLQVNYAGVGGQPVITMSTGIQYFFNPPAATVAAAAQVKLAKARALIAPAAEKQP